MAAATLLGRQRPNVSGHQRVITYSTIIFGAVGDTWKVNAVKTIFQVSLTSLSGATTPGFNISGNVITATAPGSFRGSVYGL